MIPRARRSSSWLARGRQGTAAVELALVAPMLLTLVAGIIDFARVYHDEIELSSAVAAAAQYALNNASSINSTSVTSLAATLSGIVANSNGSRLGGRHGDGQRWRNQCGHWRHDVVERYGGQCE